MAGGGGGTVHIPWYATGFRGDDFADALAEISAASMRCGATAHSVFRSRDDRYKFLQVVHFDAKDDWERYWYGEEMNQWRAEHSSWYQVPVLYVWNDVVTQGAMHPATAE